MAVKKICTKCGEAKKPALFPADKRNKDGLGSWCRACCYGNTKAWREAKKEA